MKYWSVFIGLLIIVGCFIVVRYNSYGYSYNTTRIVLGIPVFGEKWIKNISYNSHEINYINPNPFKNDHLRKTILVDRLGTIKSEADLFIIQTNHITIDVVYVHHKTNPWNITYFRTINNFKTTLSIERLRDTLKKYNIQLLQ